MLKMKQPGSLDWSSIKKRKEVDQVEEVIMLIEDHQYDHKIVEAKQKELSITERYEGNRQCISCKWVVTEKFKNEKQALRARLAAGVFEEDSKN